MRVDHQPLTTRQYKLVLGRLRNHVASGAGVEIDNDDGHSWGLCTKSLVIYAEADLHTFPGDFESRGRSSSKHRWDHLLRCPFDRAVKGRNSGCFYRCKLMRPKGFRVPRLKGEKRRWVNAPIPNREEAVALIDTAIEAAHNIEG